MQQMMMRRRKPRFVARRRQRGGTCILRVFLMPRGHLRGWQRSPGPPVHVEKPRLVLGKRWHFDCALVRFRVVSCFTEILERDTKLDIGNFSSEKNESVLFKYFSSSY